MLTILAVTGPIYLLILVGFLTVRMGLFHKPDLQVLGRYVVHLALPALVFRAVTQQHLAQAFRPDYLLVYGLGSLAAVITGLLACHHLLKQAPLARTVSVMGMACSNSGFIGYPILLLVLPEVANPVLALNMVIENLVVIPLMLMLAERAQHGAGGWQDLARIGLRVARNPLMMGLLTGLAVAVTDITLPTVMVRSIDMLAATCGAVSLIIIGGTLQGFPLRKAWRQATPILLGKLVLHPLCVALLAGLWPALSGSPLPGPLLAAAILSAAMPMFGIYPVLAQTYGDGERTSGALLSTTLLSFVTISALMIGLRAAGWL